MLRVSYEVIFQPWTPPPSLSLMKPLTLPTLVPSWRSWGGNQQKKIWEEE